MWERRRESGERIGLQTLCFERWEACWKYVPEPGLIDFPVLSTGDWSAEWAIGGRATQPMIRAGHYLCHHLVTMSSLSYDAGG